MTFFCHTLSCTNNRYTTKIEVKLPCHVHHSLWNESTDSRHWETVINQLKSNWSFLTLLCKIRHLSSTTTDFDEFCRQKFSFCPYIYWKHQSRSPWKEASPPAETCFSHKTSCWRLNMKQISCSDTTRLPLASKQAKGYVGPQNYKLMLEQVLKMLNRTLHFIIWTHTRV